MKKILILLSLFFACYSNSFSQWQLSLTFNTNETIAAISAPTDNVIWTVTNNFFIYKTIDGGNTWKRIKCKGLAANISVLQLYVINASTAFLSVNTGFTGVGPGIIYKTTDGGSNWKQVFNHVGNCEILIGMFDANKGLMSCNFSSFNGSIKPGQSLYYTVNGGNMWKIDTINNPTKQFINSLVIHGRQVALSDLNFFNYSSKYGLTWTRQKFPENSTNQLMQFEDSSYIVTLTTSSTQVIVKLPGSNAWITSNATSNNLISCLVLDGNECWLGEALDTKNNYYSSDSAKTFTPFIADPNSGFQFLTKARIGKTLVGGTPSFMTGKIWINKRQATIAPRPPLNYEARQKVVEKP
ncbi:MAG: YCF48-related protein [Parafilimonas sp.]